MEKLPTVYGNCEDEFVSLKMDSTYGDARVRWNPKNNLLYGFCWEHGKSLDMSFDTVEKIDSLAKNG